MSWPSRRDAILGAAALAATRAQAASPPPDLGFAAYRNGKRIGEHRLAFERAGGDLLVRIRAEMAVKLGPVTVFRYLHEVTERWRDGRFESLQSRTASGGKRERVDATRRGDRVLIETGEGRALAAASTIPLTHWNPEVVRAPLFNPQTGKLLKLSARELGRETVALANGRLVSARRVAFRGEAQIDDWYDEAGVWTALRGRLDDGSTMEYRRL